MATQAVKSFQGSWQQMVDTATAGKICIGKYDAFSRTIDITHEDGSVKRFAQWFFEPPFKGDSPRLLIIEKTPSGRRLLSYVNGESENGYGKIVNVCIFPLSAIVPRPLFIIKSK